MTRIEFTVTFHGPFHVGLGQPQGLTDAVVDRQVPLPGSTVKGVMRAEAEQRLGLDAELVAAVFGTGAHGSPWHWDDVALPRVTVSRGVRVAVDDATGTVSRGALVFADRVWVHGTGTLWVWQAGPIPEADVIRHLLVLRASARSVLALGAHRRRGSGTVTVTDDRAWTIEDTRALLALQEVPT